MKTFTSYLKVLLLATSIITFTSCGNDDSPEPTTGGTGGDGEPKQVEGEYAGTWLSPNEKLPTQKYRDDYKSFEIVFTEDNKYTWTFTPKSGDPGVFAGSITHDVTSSKHTSGSRIWQIGIHVSTLNGKPVAGGGWAGIYTFEDPNTLILNVEPTVSGWPKHPAADEGVGSGDKGMESVYTFIKQ